MSVCPSLQLLAPSEIWTDTPLADPKKATEACGGHQSKTRIWLSQRGPTDAIQRPFTWPEVTISVGSQYGIHCRTTLPQLLARPPSTDELRRRFHFLRWHGAAILHHVSQDHASRYRVGDRFTQDWCPGCEWRDRRAGGERGVEASIYRTFLSKYHGAIMDVEIGFWGYTGIPIPCTQTKFT